MTAPPGHTPVRATGTRLESGVVLLRDTGSTYRDGAEGTLVNKITSVRDLSSTSDELVEQARGWAEIYHLSPHRANVLRCFDIPRGARVLEIGAGCGAITRYLGELDCQVDALEPVGARATVARARTADQPDVEVFIGEIDDVPAEPSYDLVVVVGVLEYVGGGTANLDPYLAFLRAVGDRLRPGGSLLLAIENKLGVKYLAGSPEDHTGRIFDSVEGYPAPHAQARTFSRRELVNLLAAAGLDATSYVAFPDYKMTRTVMATDLPTPLESLLYRIPRFPSPDRGARRPRPKLVDEGSIWRSAVEAGIAADLGNSLVLVAHQDEPEFALWPAGQAAVFFSDGRSASRTARTTVVRDGESATFLREPLISAPAAEPELAIQANTSAFVPGVDLLDLVAAGDDATTRVLLTNWVAMLRAAHEDSGGRLDRDLVPHNLVQDDTGTLRVIDIEWRPAAVAPELVLRRGIYCLADRLASVTAPKRWRGVGTVGDLAAHLGGMVGLDPTGAWLEQFATEEAEWQARLHLPASVRKKSAAQRHEALTARQAAIRRGLLDRAGRPLTAFGLGHREFELLAAARAQLEKVAPKDLGDLLTRSSEAIKKLTAERKQVEMQARLAELQRDEAYAELARHGLAPAGATESPA